MAADLLDDQQIAELKDAFVIFDQGNNQVNAWIIMISFR
jgi:hypothetical protein